MIDLFTMLSLILQILFTAAISAIFFIKSKNLEAIKALTIYSIGIFLVNLYSLSTSILLLGILGAIYLHRYFNTPNFTYLVALTSISLINSTYTNIGLILLCNILILGLYFIFYSKIIFKNQNESKTIKLDLLEWTELNSTNTLKDKLSTFSQGILVNHKIVEIDTIREEVTLTADYER